MVLALRSLNPITVTSGSSSVSTGDDQFRDRLCEQIAKVVKRADCAEGDSLIIEFEDRSPQYLFLLKAKIIPGRKLLFLTGMTICGMSSNNSLNSTPR